MTIMASGNSKTVFPTPVTAPTTPAAPATGQPSSIKDSKNLNQTFDQFLLLLITQLKNQDPTAPMDSSQFTSQLVSFSQVEQQIKTNDNLGKLVNLTNTNQTTLGLSYIGLNVDMQGSQFEYPGSGATGMAYTLPSDAVLATINVIDANGTVVHTESGQTEAGRHAYVWDGTDMNGNQAPAGVYHLSVGAQGKDQKALSATTVVPGYVSGIMTANDGSIDLIIGRQTSQIIPLSSVTQASL